MIGYSPLLPDQGNNSPQVMTEASVPSPTSTVGADSGSTQPEAWIPGLRRYDKYWWFAEIVVLVMSIAAMVAITAILRHVQNKPLAEWTFYFQPNTVLSGLATLSRSALMFPIAECLSQLKWTYYWYCKKGRMLQALEVIDGASRGPWGASKFFFKMKKFLPVGFLASFVTLLTLGMGPFTQQILSFNTVYINTPDEVATIPISNAFNATRSVDQSGISCKLTISSAYWDSRLNHCSRIT